MTLSVSIITPSFNQGLFIERTIQSVLSQRGGDLEYIVMDGGSTDETIDILRRYDRDIRWVSEPDKGQADAVNKGIRASSGDVIGWMNSDDIYYPAAVETAVEFFDTHPDVDVLYGLANHIDKYDNIIARYPTEPWNFSRLKKVCYLCQPAVFLRRTTIDRFGLLDESLQYCMDYEYWLRLADGGAKFAYVPKLLVGSRLYADNKTLGMRVKVHREINDMMVSLFGRVPDVWIFNYAHVIWDERNLSREKYYRFVTAVSMSAIAASLRWNKSISPGIYRSIARWLVGRAWETFKRALKR